MLRPTVLLFLVLAAPASAEPKREPGKLLRDLDEQLNLSEEQRKKVHKVRQRFLDRHKDEVIALREQTKQVRQSMETARDRKDEQAMREAKEKLIALRGRADKLYGELDKNLVRILTDDQWKKWQELRKKQRP